MNNLLGRSSICVAILFFLSHLNIHAEGLKTAVITTIKNQVFISEEGEKGRAAVVKDALKSDTEITTGKNSHTELRFPDQSIVRLGSNTSFSFDSKSREMRLQRGVALVYAPPGQGGSRISTPLATAAIHDDVVAVRSAGKNGVTEFIHLSPKDTEGPMIVTYHKTSEEREVGGGQLLRVNPFEPRLQKPVDISVAVFIRSSSLFGQKDKKALKVVSSSRNTKGVAGNKTSNTSGSNETNQPSNNTGTTNDSSTTGNTTNNTGTSGSSNHDITVKTGDTPVTGSTTVTADTSVTDENTAHSTIDGSGVSTGTGNKTPNNETNESSSHDITVEAHAPIVGESTVTVDTPVTSEEFAELSVIVESKIIQEEIDQINQVEGGELVVSSQQTEESTTITVTDNSGTTPLDVDASVDSDVTLLVETENTAESLITQMTTDPINSTIIAEEDDVIEDVTEEVLCTPTALLLCPDGK